MKKALLTLLCIISLFICADVSVYADTLSEKIAQVEKSYFGYDYPDDGNLTRLDRLEKAIYGNVSHMNQQNRVQRLYKDMQIGTVPSAVSNNVAQAPEMEVQEELPPAEKDVKYPVVDKIEQKVLKKTYTSEDIYKRLSRIEMQVYKKQSSASLNERVDNLRTSVLGNDTVRDDSIVLDGYDPKGGLMSDDDPDGQYNYYTPQNTKNRVASPVVKESYSAKGYQSENYDLDMLEKQVLGKKFGGEEPENRLSRLENSVFQRTFTDNEDSRVQRLMAATTAQRTAGHYDSNKWMQRLNSGIQIGGILLMVLAMIL